MSEVVNTPDALLQLVRERVAALVDEINEIASRRFSDDLLWDAIRLHLSELVKLETSAEQEIARLALDALHVIVWQRRLN